MGFKFVDKEMQDRFDQVDPLTRAAVIKQFNSMEFKTLYKKNTNGSIQEWTVFVNKSNIHTRYGKQGGKLQTNVETISEGKNVGKTNETTPEEQALIEARASYQGKLKKGYVESLDGALAGEIDKVIGGGMFPMLAHKFSEQASKIIFPALAQPKLDGTRMIAIKKDGIWGLWSRTRKPITGLPHIIEALSKTDIDYILDGEAYNHLYKNKFEELIHFIKQEKAIPGSEVVQFHIYDIADPNQYQSKRIELLQSIKLETPLRCVATIEVDNEEELMTTFEDMLALGYEGAMVRNRLGMYVNNRSHDLQKIKTFEEMDFKIIGVEEGKGIMAGKAIFVCTTPKGDTFKAKMVGALSDLEKYITNPELAIGKMLEVSYQGMTNKNQVPRFPVGNRIKVDL